jgi:hypothetical protein
MIDWLKEVDMVEYAQVVIRVLLLSGNLLDCHTNSFLKKAKKSFGLRKKQYGI